MDYRAKSTIVIYQDEAILEVTRSAIGRCRGIILERLTKSHLPRREVSCAVLTVFDNGAQSGRRIEDNGPNLTSTDDVDTGRISTPLLVGDLEAAKSCGYLVFYQEDPLSHWSEIRDRSE